MDNKEIIKYLLEDENLITDFQNFLKENNQKVTCNWKENDKNISKYLQELKIDRKTKDALYTILDDYCCMLPF